MDRFDELSRRIDERLDAGAVNALDQAVIDTGRMVYEWRKARGLSQTELAEAIGTKQEVISRIERGLSKEGPLLKTLAAIATACGQRLVISGVPVAAALPGQEVSAESAWAVAMPPEIRKQNLARTFLGRVAAAGAGGDDDDS